jgi:hypothetical protein
VCTAAARMVLEDVTGAGDAGDAGE